MPGPDRRISTLARAGALPEMCMYTGSTQNRYIYTKRDRSGTGPVAAGAAGPYIVQCLAGR